MADAESENVNLLGMMHLGEFVEERVDPVK